MSKWAQVDGLDGYPTYTRKVHTDISYLACARKLLEAQDAVFPQFATHNAYTLAAIYQMGKGKNFEHQCLHGMGETLYDQVVGPQNLGRRVRVYAPVGTHETLLAYLVRRLLENGANTSFVNQIVDENISIDTLIRSPFETIAEQGIHLHPALPLPRNLYGEGRLNSKGIDLSNENVLQQLQEKLNESAAQSYRAASIINGKARAAQDEQPVKNPADHNDVVGTVSFADAALAQEAVATAVAAQTSWQATPAAERAAALRRFADLLEEHMPQLMMLAVREAGKTLNNAIAEVREAVDFCRYYADQAEQTLPADSRSVGTIVAISPWNFPLAIFTGEVVAALAAGNTVVAKPAEQTGLIAHYAVKLMHEAGIPAEALQLVLGAGDVGAALTQDERIGGVIFTGSTEVARLINQTLAKRSDNPVLIAETGGQNAMIVDSTALPEMIHNAPNTSSSIVSKSIAKDGGEVNYRGQVTFAKNSKRSISHIECDTIIMDQASKSDTIPFNEIHNGQVSLEHEAKVSKISEEQLFYLMSRGLSESEATEMIIMGFVEPFTKELPMEYAVELNRLISYEMEGSVG